MHIVRDPCRDLPKQRLCVFGPVGGNIGRSPNSYWALPDPKCYVSGRHCDVEFHDDAFWVRDVSRNGVFVNDATERVGYGHRARLDDGDRLRVGLYELIVRLRDRGRLLQVDGAKTAQDHLARGEAPVAETVALTTAQVGAAIHDGTVASGLEGGSATPSKSEGAAEQVPMRTAAIRVIQIDRARLRSIGLLPPESQERLIANQFRQIKRTLIANAFGKGLPAIGNGRLMMMTSALPGEGKTFSTINLALSMSREKGLEVLVVDADVAKPQVSSLFGVAKEPGLLEVLGNDALDVESLVLPTDVNGLCMLPAGRCSDDVATELLASARMEEIAARLISRNLNRIVLFDSPPLLLTNESRVLTAVVGQVVLVVRAGATPQQAVTEAIGYIGEDKPIGLILNQSKASGPGNYYGYGEYGYGAYGTSPRDAKSG